MASHVSAYYPGARHYHPHHEAVEYDNYDGDGHHHHHHHHHHYHLSHPHHGHAHSLSYLSHHHPYHHLEGGLGDWDDDDDEFYGDFDDYLARRGFMDKLNKLNPFKKSKKSQGYGRIAGEEEPGERPAKDTDSTEGIAPDSPKKGGKSKKGGR
ncbi:hypothetical protein C8Q75DRAFT_811310 [Abortiporus biennis]|nr:hypothetical protein C8Q75DRAFT_811310 [Abortiporus biennis]